VVRMQAVSFHMEAIHEAGYTDIPHWRRAKEVLKNQERFRRLARERAL